MSQLYSPQLEQRTLLRMSEVEAVLRSRRVFKSLPVRTTLIAWIDSCELNGTTLHGRHYVHEDSLVAWLDRFKRLVAA